MQISYFIGIVGYRFFNPYHSAYMQNQAYALAELTPPQALVHTWEDLDHISPAVVKAAVASEDARFFEHYGVDWEYIQRAWRYNQKQALKGKHKMRGGSTITQQVAKNLFLSDDRSYLRKGQEMILAYMLEAVMSKERILEIYLNIAEFGEGIFGIEAASQYYYNIPASQLNSTQAARLIALLPNPKRYEKNFNGRYINSRTRTISARSKQVDIPDE